MNDILKDIQYFHGHSSFRFLRKVYPEIKVCQMYALFIKNGYSEEIKSMKCGTRLLYCNTKYKQLYEIKQIT